MQRFIINLLLTTFLILVKKETNKYLEFLLKFNHILDYFIPLKIYCYLLALYKLLSYLIIIWSKLPKIELTLATVISL